MHNSWAQLPYHRSHHHHYMAESVITPPTRKRKKEVIRKAPLLLLLLLCLQRALAKCHLSPGHQLWQIQIVSQCRWPSWSRYQLLMSCKITPTGCQTPLHRRKKKSLKFWEKKCPWISGTRPEIHCSFSWIGRDTSSQTPVQCAFCRCTYLKFYQTKPEFRRTKKGVFVPGHFSDTDKVLVSFYLWGMKEV